MGSVRGEALLAWREEVTTPEMHYLIPALIVLAIVIAALAVGLAVASRNRKGLRSLSREARTRYAAEWRAIESRFIDDPAGSVGEADALVTAILRDRGAPMGDPAHLPESLRQARGAVGADPASSGTEALRRAMLYYQQIVDDGVGEKNRKLVEARSPEGAS